MHRRHLLALSSALLAGGLAGCVHAPGTNGGSIARAVPGAEPDIEDDHLRELVHQANGFAFDLYRQLIKDDPKGNLFSSPVSISIALAMTYAGAREETREQMRQVMRYTLDDDSLHEPFNALQRELNERGNIVDVETGGGYDEDDDPTPFELSIVNSVWGQEGYPFADDYLDVLSDRYGGGLREIDYTTDAEAAREEINDWVADETEDRIDELLPENSLDEMVRLVLVNAIYFFANWHNPFPENLTDEETFIALDGTEHEVAMMRESRRWQYAETDGAQAVELPYIGEEASMLVILPPEGEFETYEREFDGEALWEIVEALDAREGSVRLPRFEFKTSLQLGAVLERMGMKDAFDPHEADFSGMTHREKTEENLYIGQVYHDAFIAVDEAGTEAAAATGVVMRTVSAPMDPFSLVADRPFLFAIRDRLTDTLLFLGRVVDPGGWERN